MCCCVEFHVFVKILNDHIAAIFSGRNLSPMPSGYNLYKRGNHHLAWGTSLFSVKTRYMCPILRDGTCFYSHTGDL